MGFSTEEMCRTQQLHCDSLAWCGPLAGDSIVIPSDDVRVIVWPTCSHCTVPHSIPRSHPPKFTFTQSWLQYLVIVWGLVLV